VGISHGGCSTSSYLGEETPTLCVTFYVVRKLGGRGHRELLKKGILESEEGFFLFFPCNKKKNLLQYVGISYGITSSCT
jgi:hypothetical protein